MANEVRSLRGVPLRDLEIFALGQNTRLVGGRDDVHSPLLAYSQGGRGLVRVGVVGRINVLGDGLGRVWARGRYELEGEVGRVGRDGLQG
jgi:hypothetical protein